MSRDIKKMLSTRATMMKINRAPVGYSEVSSLEDENVAVSSFSSSSVVFHVVSLPSVSDPSSLSSVPEPGNLGFEDHSTWSPSKSVVTGLTIREDLRPMLDCRYFWEW